MNEPARNRPRAKRPVIGLTLDAEEAGGYSKFPWYALRQNYCSSIAGAGGLPLALPHEAELAADMIEEIDGLIVTGGAFDVDPALFGEMSRHEAVTLKPGRTDFEMAVTRAALAANLPVLGICGGEQLLNVALGGTLIQHIPDSVPGALAHEQPNPRDQAGHDIDIVPGTRLAAIVGAARMSVNSAHHQAVRDVGPGIVVNARAPDGVIEGIEDPSRPFCIGVEWHPEFLIDPGDRRLLAAFIEACTARVEA
jgi:putative glutamine amidotransferase